jgi:hypothetical protein
MRGSVIKTEGQCDQQCSVFEYAAIGEQTGTLQEIKMPGARADDCSANANRAIQTLDEGFEIRGQSIDERNQGLRATEYRRVVLKLGLQSGSLG